MKRRLFTALVMALTAILGSWAAKTTSAAKILDQVIATMEKAPSLSINMTLNSGKTSVPGALTMAREKFRFVSDEMTVYYDGTTQWTLDNAAGEVSVTTPTAEELIETNPLAFMHNYSHRYNVSLVSSSADKYVVRMTAKTKSTYVRSADVTINAATMLPATVTATLSTGQNMTIYIASATKGKALPLATFRFDKKKHPNVEVIDLR